jgi:alanine racemase
VSLQDTVLRYMAGTHALIDLDAYVQNLRELRALSPDGAALMAVVKADAYGHGAVHCALAAAPVVDWLGVARIQEGIALRKRDVRSPILVLGPPNAREISDAIREDITLTVGTLEHIEQVSTAARLAQSRVGIHLKVDTGMRRYGFMPHDTVAAAEAIVTDEWLHLEGIFTHFSSSDETDPGPTERQLARFESTLERLRERRIAPRFIHCANSAAILARRTGATNLVRSGIATYGISPSDEVPVSDRFRQIMSVRTTVTRRFALETGDGVSYGQTYRASGLEEVAATGAGYADGLPRQLSNTGWFVAGDSRHPIRGRVCMDQTVIAADSGMAVGDLVDVIGPGDRGVMTLDNVARIAGTNSYEIATRLTARVPRLYVRGGRVVACEHTLLAESAQ